MPLGMEDEFAKAQYVSRDLKEVSEMGAREFEIWVNEFYRAVKPRPDAGVDGITTEGIPIQAKTSHIGYDLLGQFITDAKCHPATSKPIRKVIVVSQKGFDDRARKRQFAIKTTEDIEVILATPKEMLKLEA